MPFVPKNSKFCIQCPADQPVFDAHLGVCISTCPSNQHYNITSNKCEAGPLCVATETCSTPNPCILPQFYNAATKQCQSCPINNQYYNSTSRACLFCPPETPLYSPATFNCQPCPSGTSINYAQNQCQ